MRWICAIGDSSGFSELLRGDSTAEGHRNFAEKVYPESGGPGLSAGNLPNGCLPSHTFAKASARKPPSPSSIKTKWERGSRTLATDQGRLPPCYSIIGLVIILRLSDE